MHQKQTDISQLKSKQSAGNMDTLGKKLALLILSSILYVFFACHWAGLQSPMRLITSFLLAAMTLYFGIQRTGNHCARAVIRARQRLKTVALATQRVGGVLSLGADSSRPSGPTIFARSVEKNGFLNHG
jgi:hypothetical protein